jgi:hypothetical protein
MSHILDLASITVSNSLYQVICLWVYESIYLLQCYNQYASCVQYICLYVKCYEYHLS